MDYQEAVKRIAPCGLDCSRCADYAGGEIRQLCARLAELLQGYHRVAKVKADKKPAFAGYSQFEEVLGTFSQAACSGCRGDSVLCPFECAPGRCTREKGVDFCFQCGEFPCTREVSPVIRERWLDFNRRMQEIGVVDFYRERSRLPRY